MTRAWLPVTEMLKDYLPLPDGFKTVWERKHRIDGCFYLLIEGPFPDEIEDGDEIGAVYHVGTPIHTVQWNLKGEPVGKPAPLPQPKHWP